MKPQIRAEVEKKTVRPRKQGETAKKAGKAGKSPARKKSSKAAARKKAVPVKEHIVEQIPLGRSGDPADIANAVLFLVRDATYSTGQIIAIDGGRSVGW